METGTLSQQNHRHHWFRCVIVPILAALAVSACGNTDDGMGEPSGPVSYQVTFIADGQDGIGPTRAVIGLDEEFAVLDGNSGCHRILGSFTLDDASGKAGFTVPGRSTNNCDPDEELVEELLLAAFEEVVSFRRFDSRLEFFGPSQNRLLAFDPIS